MAFMAKKVGKKSKYKGTPTLEVLEGAHRYNNWIAQSILPFVRPPVLEIGAGIGNLSALFIHKSPITLSDLENEFVNILKDKFSQEKKVLVKKFDISRSPDSSMIKKYNTVISVNVLEHIEDDFKALANLKKTLNINGKIIILVPAKKIAFSKLDKELGHFRRYEKEELSSLLSRAGFRVEKIGFFNIVGLLTWITRNYLSSQNVQLTARQVAMFDSIVPIIKPIEKRIKIPVGISLIAVATNE